MDPEVIRDEYLARLKTFLAEVRHACGEAASLKLISEGALDGGNLEQLAERVGIGSRHLRRLFQRHLGASPLKIARSYRVLVAKNLIVETQLPMTEIALATGFRSIRQFNHSVRTAFGKSPTKLRGIHGAPAAGNSASEIIVQLPYRPPFDWSSLLEFLKVHSIPGVERVEDETYRRTIEVGGAAGAIEVWNEPGDARLSMRVLLPGCEALMQVVQRARRLFDLGADALHIGSYLARDARMASMVANRPGLRVPGAWNGFELAVLAVAGQNLEEPPAARLTIERIVKAFGKTIQVSVPGLSHLFPRPEVLADANLESIGIPANQAEAISALAREVVNGRIALDSMKGAGDAAMRLSSLPGFDEETAGYIAMRAMGDPDAFCGVGSGFRKALAIHKSPLPAEEVSRIFERCRPWRAYAAMHCWTSVQHSARRTRSPCAATSSSARSIRRRSTALRRSPPRS